MRLCFFPSFEATRTGLEVLLVARGSQQPRLEQVAPTGEAFPIQSYSMGKNQRDKLDGELSPGDRLSCPTVGAIPTARTRTGSPSPALSRAAEPLFLLGLPLGESAEGVTSHIKYSSHRCTHHRTREF